MTTTRFQIATSPSAMVLALLLQQPVLAEEAPPAAAAALSNLAQTQPATAPAAQARQPAVIASKQAAPAGTAAPTTSDEVQPTVEPATQTRQPAEHPAQAALARLKEQRAVRVAELQKRYEKLRTEAAGYGFEMPPAPPWTAGPQWLTHDEMRELMKAQGVEMPAAPSPEAKVTLPAMTTPPMASGIAEERKQMLETYEQMTPEEKEACFALFRRYGAGMLPRMHPAQSRPAMPQYPQGYGPGFGQSYPGRMQPQR